MVLVARQVIGLHIKFMSNYNRNFICCLFSAPKKFNCKASSLVEVLISILLFAIVIAGGLGFYSYATHLQALATHKKIATQIANVMMEEYKSKLYSDPVLNLDPGGHTVPCTFNVDNLYVCWVYVQSPNSDYKQVKVGVKWSEVGMTADQWVNMTTFRVP